MLASDSNVFPTIRVWNQTFNLSRPISRLPFQRWWLTCIRLNFWKWNSWTRKLLNGLGAWDTKISEQRSLVEVSLDGNSRVAYFSNKLSEHFSIESNQIFLRQRSFAILITKKRLCRCAFLEIFMSLQKDSSRRLCISHNFDSKPRRKMHMKFFVMQLFLQTASVSSQFFIEPNRPFSLHLPRASSLCTALC